MDHSARISASTKHFHIDLDSENLHMWMIIGPDGLVEIITIWAKDIVSQIGSISVNIGDLPGLPYTY